MFASANTFEVLIKEIEMARQLPGIQLRGHCQCCGRLQAVPNGFMSKHGYQVKEGWFQGVCSGERYAPIERDRAQADSIVAMVRGECAALRDQAAALRAGEAKPVHAKSGNRVPDPSKRYWELEDELVPFDQAPRHYQVEAVEAAAWKAQRRAEVGESFAAFLEGVANEYHGKALIEVKADAGPAPIRSGERRVSQRGVLVANYCERGMVHWKDDRGFGSKMSSRSWRALPMAPAA
jgi:hypothetical protein